MDRCGDRIDEIPGRGPHCGRRRAGRGHLALIRSRCPAYGRTRITFAIWRIGHGAFGPKNSSRTMCSPHANGGPITRELELPAIAEYAVPAKAPGAEHGEQTKALGGFLWELRACRHSLARPTSLRSAGRAEIASSAPAGDPQEK
jgi:hypothetical protein